MPLGLTTGLLAIARILLTRRLGIEGGSGILLVLRSFDRLFERTDTFLFRRKHVRDLPDIQPVWWLEVNRRSLTNARYLVRIFLPIYGLAFIIGTAAPQEISGLFGLCMALLLLPLIVIHASALAQERGQQTLDVLLSTPMSGLSVLRQKSRALARLRWGVSGCLLMLVFIQFCCLRYSDRISTLRISIWVAASILIPGICCWIALLVGVGLKNHRKAAIAAICCCIGWLFGLPLLIALISSLVTDQNLGNSTWQVLCPLFLIANTDDDELMRVLGVPGLACTLAGYVALWWGLRLGCLRWGSRWLYRSRARASQ